MSAIDDSLNDAERLAAIFSDLGSRVAQAHRETSVALTPLDLHRLRTMHSVRECLMDTVEWRLEAGFCLLRHNPRRWWALPRSLKRELAMLDPAIYDPSDRAAALMELRTWFHPGMWPEVVAPHLPHLDRVAIHLTPFPVSRHVAAIAKATVERWSPMWDNSLNSTL
jgi:hypothetical protein